MDSHHILSFLGLSLRGGRLAVGEEPVESVARARDARVLLLAADAAENTCRRAAHFAEAGQCLLLQLPFTKAELGRALGRTSAAIVAVTDIGLANALVRKLAELDETAYGDASRRLELKAKRAAERQAEQRAHEKNIRAGKRRLERKPPPELATKRTHPSKEAERERSGAGHRPNKKRTASPGSPAGRNPSGGGNSASRHGARIRSSPQARSTLYPHSRPVKKGKGSCRRRKP